MKVLVDTGPLVAFFNRRDRFHSWTQQQLATLDPPLHTCEPVLSETCFLLRRQEKGPRAVLDLIDRGLLRVAFQLEEEVTRVRQIMTRFADLPASLADACLVRMAEIHSGSRILTFDSDFTVYRMHDRKVIPLISP